MELQEGSKESFGRYSQRLAIATVAQMKQKQPSQAYPARLVVCCRSPDIGMISSRSVIERETTPLKKFITYVEPRNADARYCGWGSSGRNAIAFHWMHNG